MLEVTGEIYQGSPFSAGYDLITHEQVTIYPAPRGTLIHTGVFLSEQWKLSGYMGVVVPRSSSAKKGLFMGNTIGIIDPDYQGEILVNLMTHESPITLEAGERIAQLIAVPFAPINSDFLITNDTVRNKGGFGSTGDK